MFDPTDHLWGEVAGRRRGGGLTVNRVAWRVFRWRLVQFAKFVLVEFDIVASSDMVEAAVDAWLERTPPI